MSNINLGSQSVCFDYKNEATAKSFNTFLRNILKSGIYKGGELSKADNTIVAIAPFDAWFNISTDKAAHILTTDTILLSVSYTTPVLYMTYSWSDTENNWIDFAFKAIGDPVVTNEIILGTINFSGSNLAETFDYTNRTTGLIDSSNNLYALNSIKFDNILDVSLYKSALNTLSTPNNLIVGGSLNVIGPTTLNGINGNLTVTGDTTIKGNESVTGNLSVTGTISGKYVYTYDTGWGYQIYGANTGHSVTKFITITIPCTLLFYTPDGTSLISNYYLSAIREQIGTGETTPYKINFFPGTYYLSATYYTGIAVFLVGVLGYNTLASAYSAGAITFS